MTASAASADNATLTAALDLARRGYRVFPVGLDKTPLIKNGHNGATTDKQQIYKWWGKEGCGVAVATGNGLMVIDLDVKKGKDGITSLAELEAANSALPRTPRVCTPTRGQHLWLRVNQKIQCSVGRVGHGIDIRGDGGYVVVPPTHVDHTDKTGAHIVGDYTWITSLDECDIPPAPQWLIDKALDKSTASLGTSPLYASRCISVF
jgi:Bifunctional DNA primase/polymerase, N-terminal